MSRLARPSSPANDLSSEIAKLRKINQVLMDRVERSTDWQGSAFSLFQAATVLEGQIAERTAALRAANDALRQAKEAAERANQSKTKFLAAASHDLLQPLNAAKLFTAALMERGHADEANDRLLGGIGDALESIDALLRALFDISKLDAGVMEAELTDIPLEPLLAQLQREYAPQMAVAGLDFSVVPCSLTVRSDSRLLARVLWNFVSNAMRYTEKGRILLGCRRRGNVVTIEVWDTGSGIPDNRLDDIFQEFRQIGPPGRGRDKGLGLGLAIVDRIARLLHHPIRVRSRLDKGSVFGIDVPIVKGSPPARLPVRAQSNPAKAADLRGVEVLLVDDDRPGLNALTELLRAWGCNPIAKHSSADVKRWLKTQPAAPAAIIADFHLGEGQHGMAVISAVRQALGPTIPGCIVTSDRAPELKAAIKAAGLALVNKPIQAAALRAALSHLLSRKAKVAD